MMATLTIFTDGGARGNPGPAAVGVVIHRDGVLVEEAHQYLGDRFTNNWAEYEAVVFALLKALELGFSGENIDFKLDSQLVVEQLNRNWKIKEPTLKPQAEKVWSLLKNFGAVTFSHIRREQNSEADRLVNKALDSHT